MAPMTESTRERLERSEARGLAPWAIRSSNAKRRFPLEDQGREYDYRTAFQRDRDRILYSRAFRRLRQKAQAGLLGETEDHRRNRLTHTLEVSQLARTMGRALGLNEDLVEAIALAHDLGQPPFGSAGERQLDRTLPGGFAACWQALRVVDRIEKRYDHPGLNLTDDVREGIAKCGGARRVPKREADGLRGELAPSYEAQVVGLADRLARCLHDLEDAIQAGTVPPAAVERLSAVRELRKKLGDRYPGGSGTFVRANAIHRGLTHLLVTGAVLASRRSLEAWAERNRVRSARDFLRVRDQAVGSEIRLSDSGARMLGDLERFVERRVRRGEEADRFEVRAGLVVRGLVSALVREPRLLPTYVLLRFRELAGGRYLRDLTPAAAEEDIARRYRASPVLRRLVGDHVAGMTDKLALASFAELREIGATGLSLADPRAMNYGTDGRQEGAKNDGT